MSNRCDARSGLPIELKHADRVGQLLRFALHGFGCSCGFLDQRSVLLGHLVHLANRFVDLADSFALLMRGSGNFGDDGRYPLHALDHLADRGARFVHQHSADVHFVHRIVDEDLDLLGCCGRALREGSDLTRDDCKATALFAGAGRFDRRAHCQTATRSAVENNDLAKKMALEASHDSLTGLPNRRIFFDRWTQPLVAKHQREHRPFTLLLIDLDGFKKVNDTLGHNVDDDVLQEAAARLQSVLREGEFLAWLGGDEFGLVMGTCPAPKPILAVGG